MEQQVRVKEREEPSLSFEGMKLPKGAHTACPLQGDFGEFSVIWITGFHMWDTFEIRPPDGKPPLSFFLHNYQPGWKGPPYWAARFPLNCSDDRLFEVLDACRDSSLVRLWRNYPIDRNRPNIEAYPKGHSPAWSAGVILWKGGETIGISPAVFKGVTSWSIFQPQRLNRHIETKLRHESQSFPFLGPLTAVRIAGEFGSVQFDLAASLVGNRRLEVASPRRDARVVEELYNRLVLNADKPDSTLQRAVGAVVAHLR